MDYFNEMTFAEYRLRSFAYYRMQDFEWAKFRKVAFSALIGAHYDPKKLPRNERDFMPLVNVDKYSSPLRSLTVDAVERFKEEYKKYKDLKDAKMNNTEINGRL